MADSQGVPVFIRHYDEADPQFLGRFPLVDLDDLVRAVREHSCYTGNDPTDLATSQFICYHDAMARRWNVGFEVIVGLDEVTS